MSRRPPASDDTEDGFLRRWSRRKAGAEEPVDAGDEAARREKPGESAPGTEQAPPREDGEPEQVKTDEDMPDLDLIDENTDVSDFFSPGVSEELRSQALRRLFRMPKFNVTDGLDDYNEDFRNFALLGDIVTSDMRHRAEREEARLREMEQADEPEAGNEDSATLSQDEGVAAASEEETPEQGREMADTDNVSDDDAETDDETEAVPSRTKT